MAIVKSIIYRDRIENISLNSCKPRLYSSFCHIFNPAVPDICCRNRNFVVVLCVGSHHTIMFWRCYYSFPYFWVSMDFTVLVFIVLWGIGQCQQLLANILKVFIHHLGIQVYFCSTHLLVLSQIVWDLFQLKLVLLLFSIIEFDQCGQTMVAFEHSDFIVQNLYSLRYILLNSLTLCVIVQILVLVLFANFLD